MKDKKKKNQVTIEDHIEDTPVVEIIPDEQEEKPVQISSKQFIKKLKTEVTGIPLRVFDAFIKAVTPVDTEDNYQKIWKTTFKRH